MCSVCVNLDWFMLVSIFVTINQLISVIIPSVPFIKHVLSISALSQVLPAKVSVDCWQFNDKSWWKPVFETKIHLNIVKHDISQCAIFSKQVFKSMST